MNLRITYIAVLFLTLTACDDIKREFQPWRLGIGEEHRDYIEEPHRPLPKQPSPGRLVQQRAAEEQRHMPMMNQLHRQDIYDTHRVYSPAEEKGAAEGKKAPEGDASAAE